MDYSLDTATMTLAKEYMEIAIGRNSIPEDIENLEDVAAWLIDGDKKPFLFLLGNVGNGKTTMASAIQKFTNDYQSHIEQHFPNQIALSRPRFRYVTARDLSDKAQNKDLLDDYKAFKYTDMLIVDDLGTEAAEVKLYGNVINPLVDVLYSRYNEMQETIITSNLTPAEIKDRYGDRLNDRLREVSKIITFKNESYR